VDMTLRPFEEDGVWILKDGAGNAWRMDEEGEKDEWLGRFTDGLLDPDAEEPTKY